jgi:thiamine pyrophosphokinase
MKTIIGEKDMKNGICYIIGSGENYGIDFIPRAEDYVIAADGGFRYLDQAGIAADLIIGDFDTLERRPEHPNVIVLNSEKDDTDTLAAVRVGIKAGYGRFYFYACAGGRIEHTVANIQVLAFLSENGMKGFLFDRDSVMTAVTNGTVLTNERSCASVPPVCLHGVTPSPHTQNVNVKSTCF